MDISTLNLPEPHGGQKQVLESKARVKVVVAGRRFGKDELGIRQMFAEAAAGHNGYWVGSSFNAVQSTFHRARKGIVDGYACAEMSIQCPNHVLMRFMTHTHFYEKTRGVDFSKSFVVINDPEIMSHGIWGVIQELVSMGGRILIMGTPKVHEKGERDYFRELYYAANYYDGWRGWQFNTGINPYIDMVEIGRMSVDMPANAFKSEILAEFVEVEKQPQKPADPDYFKRFV